MTGTQRSLLQLLSPRFDIAAYGLYKYIEMRILR